MRIDELTPYRKTAIYKVGEVVKSDYVRDIYNTLYNMGYVKTEELLGSGIFGAVFKRESDPYVIKLFQGDTGYLTYLKYVLAHQENPHVPKIRGKLMKPYKDAALYLVRMEQLMPLRNDVGDANSEIFYLVKDYFYKRQVDDTLQKKYPQLAKLADDIKQMGRTIDFHDYNAMIRPGDSTFVITDPLI